MPRHHRDAQRRLFEIAEVQQGFFTAKQAKAAGFAENTHPYHVQVGNWIREHRGIYRLALFPIAEHPDLVKWALWSRNRNEAPEGVYSHQTALSLYELSDLNPAKLHMTVATHFRRNSEIPGIHRLPSELLNPPPEWKGRFQALAEECQLLRRHRCSVRRSRGFFRPHVGRSSSELSFLYGRP